MTALVLLGDQAAYTIRGLLKHVSWGFHDVSPPLLKSLVLMQFYDRPLHGRRRILCTYTTSSSSCISSILTIILQTPYNYFRALQWAAVTAFVAHVDPAFSGVFGIEAVNEPLLSAAMTPGYGDCEFPIVMFPRCDRSVYSCFEFPTDT